MKLYYVAYEDSRDVRRALFFADSGEEVRNLLMSHAGEDDHEWIERTGGFHIHEYEIEPGLVAVF